MNKRSPYLKFPLKSVGKAIWKVASLRATKFFSDRAKERLKVDSRNSVLVSHRLRLLGSRFKSLLA
jgi:hypothetical protein